MNYGIFDAQNFAWKFHLVESGFAAPSLLESYEQERKEAAARLIDFDVQYAKLFSSRPPSAAELKSAGNSLESNEAPNETEFMKYFKKASSFTSGYEVNYGVNNLNWRQPGGQYVTAFNFSNTKLIPGRNFPGATVIRVMDAHICELDQEVPFNGSYRICVFAGDMIKNRSAIVNLGAALGSQDSFLRGYAQAERMSYKTRHNPQSPCYTFCIIFNNHRASIELDDALTDFLKPYCYHVYADDISQTGVRGCRGSVHEKMGFDQEKGGVAIVRPDGIIACCLSLGDGTVTAHGINEYFKSLSGR
jgi:hypothetical protein